MPAAALRSWKHIALFLLAFSPALFTARLITTKAVDVAAWDEWETAATLVKWHDGTLTWNDLYAAQIQHRMVVPRLLTIALAHLSGGDFRWNVYACVTFVLLNAVLLWKLLQRTMAGSPWRWPLMFAFNLLLFSPMHYETQFWGSSMWGSIPMPCLLTALIVLTPRLASAGEMLRPAQSWGRFAAALLLTEIATHSFAHGLAMWPVLLLLILINPALGPQRTRLIQGGLWLLAAGLTLWAYFTNFINVAFHAYNLKPGDHAMKGASNLLEGDHLRQSFDFVRGYFGAWFARTPFVDHPLEDAIFLGSITLPVFALLLGFAIFSRRVRAQWPSLLPWLGLGCYALTVGLMISKRAADTGVHRAVMTRYLAQSQYLLVSSLALAALVGAALLAALWSLIKKSKKAPSDAAVAGGTVSMTGAVLLTAFLMASLPVWIYGLHLNEAAQRGRRHAQALMLLLPHLQEQKKLISMKPLCRSFDYCLHAINELQRIGLMRTPPLASPELKSFRQDTKTLSLERADITSAQYLDDGTVELAGHARFGADAPADLVLVVQSGRIIGIGQPAPRHILRIFALDFDMTNVEEVPFASMHPWRGQIDPSLVPAPGAPVELWALDVHSRTVARFARTLTLEAATRQVKLQ